MELDKRLMHDMETLFQSSEARIVLAFEVEALQHGAHWGIGKASKQGKRRILCVTGKRKKASRGFRCMLHIVKEEHGTESKHQVRRSLRLKHLSRVKVAHASGDQAGFSLGFTSAMGSSLNETWVSLRTAGGSDCMPLLACIYRLSMEHAGHKPEVSGIGAAELERVSMTQNATALLGEFGAELLHGAAWAHAEPAGGSGDGRGGCGEALDSGAHTDATITSGEERDLKDLMGAFQIGIGDAETFMERLGDELMALEAANVHSILEGAPMVERLLKRLDSTLHLLDDLEAQMSVYNFRLQHMRDDIEAIEQRNNRLELASQNGSALLATTTSMLETLDVPGDCKRVLLTADLSTARGLSSAVKAAWQLRRTLWRLTPGEEGSLSSAVLQMRAVRHRRVHLANAAKAFVQRATSFLANRFHALGEATVPSDIQREFRSGLLTAAERHRACDELAPLVQITAALDPRSITQLSGEYAGAVNALLRRQLRICASLVRADVRLSRAHSKPKAAPGSQRARAGRVVSPFHRHTTSARQHGLRPGASPASPAASPSAVSSPGGKMPTGQYDRIPTLLLSASHEVEPHSLDEAYAKLLNVFMPLLLQEVEYAADLLFLNKDTDGAEARAQGEGQGNGPEQSGRAAVSAAAKKAAAMLLDGVDGEVLQVVDMSAKGNQQLCVPMLGATIRHRAKLSGIELADPLRRMLSECEKRLRANLEAFVSERVAAIAKFEPRAVMTANSPIKFVNVAPFVQSFGPLVDRFEELISACKHDSGHDACASKRGRHRSRLSRASDADHVFDDRFGGADSGHSSSQISSDTPEESANRPTGENGGNSDAARRDQVSNAEQNDTVSLRERFAGTCGTSAAEHYQLRSSVDGAYQRIVSAMVSSIERLAESDSKYGNKLRLENYAAILTTISRHAKRAPILNHFQDFLVQKRESALQNYVQEQLDYSRLGELLSFSGKLEQLLLDVGPRDVKFQLNFSSKDVSQILDATTSGMDKKLKSMKNRIEKHFASLSNELVDIVWRRCKDALLERYQSLHARIHLCYPHTEVHISVEELRTLLNQI